MTFSPGEAYARRRIQYLSFPRWLRHAILHGGECPLTAVGCCWPTACLGEMNQLSVLGALRQSPSEPWSNETEKDEDQGKAKIKCKASS